MVAREQINLEAMTSEDTEKQYAHCYTPAPIPDNDEDRLLVLEKLGVRFAPPPPLSHHRPCHVMVRGQSDRR